MTKHIYGKLSAAQDESKSGNRIREMPRPTFDFCFCVCVCFSSNDIEPIWCDGVRWRRIRDFPLNWFWQAMGRASCIRPPKVGISLMISSSLIRVCSGSSACAVRAVSESASGMVENKKNTIKFLSRCE